MNLEKYLISILKNDLKGYDSYLVGESILKYILGKPIEEYLVITSAPLFSFSTAKKKSSNQIELTKYPKKILIQLNTTKEEYLQKCQFSYETLLFHIERGIIDSMGAILDIQRKVIRSVKLNFDPIQATKILYLCESFHFQIEEDIRLRIYHLPSIQKVIDRKQFFKEFQKILLLDTGIKILKEYQSFFQAYIPLEEPTLEVLRYTSTTFILRLLALLWYRDKNGINLFFSEYGIEDQYFDSVQTVLFYRDYDLTIKPSKQLFEQLGKDIFLWLSLKRAEALSLGQLEKIRLYDEAEKNKN